MATQVCRLRKYQISIIDMSLQFYLQITNGTEDLLITTNVGRIGSDTEIGFTATFWNVIEGDEARRLRRSYS